MADIITETKKQSTGWLALHPERKPKTVENQKYYTLDDVDTFGKTAYYQMPKWIFEGEYKEMTNTERCIYSLLSDRFRLSLKNGWKDETGNVYVIYSSNELAEILNVSTRTIQRCFKTLIKLKLIITEICENSLKKRNILKIFLLKPDVDTYDSYSAIEENINQEGEELFCDDVNADKEAGTEAKINHNIMSNEGDKMSQREGMTKCRMNNNKDNSINKNNIKQNNYINSLSESVSFTQWQTDILEKNINPDSFEEKDKAIVSDIISILKTCIFSKTDDLLINVGNKKEPEMMQVGVLKTLFLEKLNCHRVKIYLTQFREYCRGITNPINYHIKSLYRQCLCQSTIYQVMETVY